jgi:hypothetical protein
VISGMPSEINILCKSGDVKSKLSSSINLLNDVKTVELKNDIAQEISVIFKRDSKGAFEYTSQSLSKLPEIIVKGETGFLTDYKTDIQLYLIN